MPGKLLEGEHDWLRKLRAVSLHEIKVPDKIYSLSLIYSFRNLPTDAHLERGEICAALLPEGKVAFRDIDQNEDDFRFDVDDAVALIDLNWVRVAQALTRDAASLTMLLNLQKRVVALETAHPLDQLLALVERLEALSDRLEAIEDAAQAEPPILPNDDDRPAGRPD
jgi:hypothetical protein